MAEVLWPMMIPLSVLFMEENKKRIRILWILLFMGISVSLYYAFCLLFFNVTPQIMGYHIQYRSDFPKSLTALAFIVYFIASITPLFVSSIQRTHLLGILMFLSCVVTAVFFWQYLASVWCFFAAFISGVIFWILRDSKRKFNFDKINLLKISSNQPTNK
jgi:Na+/melibiose symporter-like transporter